MREEIMEYLEVSLHLRTVLWRQLRANERPVSIKWASLLYPVCLFLQYLRGITPKPTVHRTHVPGLTHIFHSCPTALQEAGPMDTSGGA